jgi:multiple sugar transport system permease protein
MTFFQEVVRYRELYLMMIPFGLVFIFFTILPVISAVVLSFSSFNMFSFPEFIGLDNYIDLFVSDTVFYTALKNTLVFAVITGPVSYFLCLFMAWLINEMGRTLRVVFTVAFYAPSLCSSVFFIWQYIFSGDSYGIMNSIIMRLGISDEPIQWLSNETYMLAIVIIVQLWMSLGTSFLSLIAGFQGVDRSLYEAAEVDGVKNRWQEFTYITLPLLKPQLIFSAIMQIVSAFSVSSVSQTLCGLPSTNYAAHTIVLHIVDYGSIRYEMGYACAISTILFLLMLGSKKLVDICLKRIPDTK